MGNLDLVGLGVTELEIEVARLTAELIPSVEMSISTMSGTEATMQAVRLSRAITGRKYLLTFQGCFHGWHDAVARNVASSSERAYTRLEERRVGAESVRTGRLRGCPYL